MTASMPSNARVVHYRQLRTALLGLVATLVVACGNKSTPGPVGSVGGDAGTGGEAGSSGTSGAAGEGGTNSGGSGGASGSSGTAGSSGRGGSAGSSGRGGASGSAGTGGSGGSGATGGSSGSGGSGATGGSGGSGGSGGTTTGGPGGSSGSGGSGGLGGSAGDGGVPPDGGTGEAALCVASQVWAPLVRIASIPNDHLYRFSAITPDQLVAAWTSGSGDIYVAERASFKDDFGAPVKVNSSSLATDRAALAPTGRTIIAVTSDHSGLVGFEKNTTGEWVVSSGVEFTQVRVAFEGGALVSNPVLSSDKRSFFFVVTPAGKASTLREAVWDSVQRSWGLPATLPNDELSSPVGDKRRRPTGMSYDGRTLFFFDETVGLERAAWRNTPDSAFSIFKDIGAFAEAVPTQRCDTLYYQSQDVAGVGVFKGD